MIFAKFVIIMISSSTKTVILGFRSLYMQMEDIQNKKEKENKEKEVEEKEENEEHEEEKTERKRNGGG